MGKNSGGGSTTTVQKADPWEKQQPYLEDIFRQAQGLYQQAGPYYYPGDTVANFRPQEKQAQAWVQQYAQNGARDLTNQGLSAQSFLLGDVLRADSNPYMAQYAEGAIRPVWDQLARTGLPGVQSGAVAAGQFGGSRQGIAEGLAMSDAVQKSLDTTAGMYGQMYGQNLDAMQKATMLNPSMVQGGTLPAQLLAGVGEQQRSYQQSLMDDAVARWNYQQGLPSAKLKDYMGTIQGTYGGASSSTTEGNVGQTSTAGKIAGAGMSALGTYGFLNSAAGAAALEGGLGLAAGSAAMIAPWAAGAIALISLLG